MTDVGQARFELPAALHPDEAERWTGFLSLTSWEVEHEANRQARRSPAGTTWLSLSKLMQKRGYLIVGELGVPAAISWGIHLGVLPAQDQAVLVGDRPAGSHLSRQEGRSR